MNPRISPPGPSNIQTPYYFDVVGSVPAPTLQAAFADVPLDQGFLTMVPLTVVGDATSAPGPTITRTITLQPSAAFLQQYPTPADQLGAVQNWMTDVFTKAMRTPVFAGAPTFVAPSGPPPV